MVCGVRHKISFVIFILFMMVVNRAEVAYAVITYNGIGAGLRFVTITSNTPVFGPTGGNCYPVYQYAQALVGGVWVGYYGNSNYSPNVVSCSASFGVDGSQSTTLIGADGAQTTTTTYPDGSSVITVTNGVGVPPDAAPAGTPPDSVENIDPNGVSTFQNAGVATNSNGFSAAIASNGVLAVVATAITALLAVSFAIWGGRRVIGLFR